MKTRERSHEERSEEESHFVQDRDIFAQQMVSQLKTTILESEYKRFFLNSKKQRNTMPNTFATIKHDKCNVSWDL